MLNIINIVYFLVNLEQISRAAKKQITAINSAVLEQVNVILKQSNYFAILSDGSQARKTGDDKELVLLKSA